MDWWLVALAVFFFVAPWWGRATLGLLRELDEFRARRNLRRRRDGHRARSRKWRRFSRLLLEGPTSEAGKLREERLIRLLGMAAQLLAVALAVAALLMSEL